MKRRSRRSNAPHDTRDPALTKSSLQQFVVRLRQRDVKPISCHTYIKALNAFCLWLRDEGQGKALLSRHCFFVGQD